MAIHSILSIAEVKCADADLEHLSAIYTKISNWQVFAMWKTQCARFSFKNCLHNLLAHSLLDCPFSVFSAQLQESAIHYCDALHCLLAECGCRHCMQLFCRPSTQIWTCTKLVPREHQNCGRFHTNLPKIGYPDMDTLKSEVGYMIELLQQWVQKAETQFQSFALLVYTGSNTGPAAQQSSSYSRFFQLLSCMHLIVVKYA